MGDGLSSLGYKPYIDTTVVGAWNLTDPEYRVDEETRDTVRDAYEHLLTADNMEWAGGLKDLEKAFRIKARLYDARDDIKANGLVPSVAKRIMTLSVWVSAPSGGSMGLPYSMWEARMRGNFPTYSTQQLYDELASEGY